MYAGPKLNLMKTQAIFLNGNFNECVDGLQWSEEPVKYLGVFLNIMTMHNKINLDHRP